MDLRLRRTPASIALLVEVGAARGIEPDRILTPAGLTRDDLGSHAPTVTAGQELDVIKALVALADDPGLGAHAGRRYHVSTYGLFGFALMTSRTATEAIATGLTMLDLSYAFTTMTFRSNPDRIIAVPAVADLTPEVEHFVVSRDLAAVQQLREELLGATSTDGEPRVRGNELHFDPAELTRTLPQANTHAAAMAREQCLQLLRDRRPASGVSDSVRAAIVDMFPSTPRTPELASALHLSERSLRRRLSGEGTSVRALITEVRHEFAKELLAEGMGVADVAYRLGYAETSSFSHAFRNWTGRAPREWSSGTLVQ